MHDTLTLRDGSVVSDKHWAALSDADSNAINWSMDADDFTKPEMSHSWLATTKLDQGVSGGCVGFAFANLLAAEPLFFPGIDYDFAMKNIYFEAQKIDRWAGGEYPEAQPFSSGTSVLAAAKVLKRDGYFKEYRWVTSLEAMSLSVSHKGPLVAGVDWFEQMKKPDINGFIRPEGKRLGRHCITVIANHVVRNKNTIDRYHSYFFVLNPAQAKWGVDGVGFLRHIDAASLLNGAEICIPIGEKNHDSYHR